MAEQTLYLVDASTSVTYRMPACMVEKLEVPVSISETKLIGPDTIVLAQADPVTHRILGQAKWSLQFHPLQDRLAAGRTLNGPHRSDLAVIHRPTGAPASEASTGQQKALLIGLILASAEALCASGGGPAPLLLLDEAAAHLDPDRRKALFDELAAMRGQAWLTGTDAYLFETFGTAAQRVRVESSSAALEP
jgi:recombinational DNA repair ATPase RecF